MKNIKRTLCVGAIAAAAALGAVGTAAAASAPASQADVVPAAQTAAVPAVAAQWTLWAQHISAAQCHSEGPTILATVPGALSYDCDVTDAGAHDAPLVALWVFE